MLSLGLIAWCGGFWMADRCWLVSGGGGGGFGCRFARFVGLGFAGFGSLCGLIQYNFTLSGSGISG